MERRWLRRAGACLFVANLGYFLFITIRPAVDFGADAFPLAIAFVVYIAAIAMWFERFAFHENGIRADWALGLFSLMGLPVFLPNVFNDGRWTLAAMLLPLVFLLNRRFFVQYERDGTTLVQCVFATQGILHLRQWSHASGMPIAIVLLTLTAVLLAEVARRGYGRVVAAPASPVLERSISEAVIGSEKTEAEPAKIAETS